MSFPNRQKLILSAYLLCVVIITSSYFNNSSLNQLLFYFTFLTPMALLVTPAIIDLQNTHIFGTWLTIGLIQLVAYFYLRDGEQFRIVRSQNFNPNEGVNTYFSDFSTGGLKSLVIFLGLYKILDFVSMRATGNHVINTYFQTTWNHDKTGRRMNILDVIFNLLLFAAIIASVLFD